MKCRTQKQLTIMPEPSKFLSKKEVAELLGVTPITVFNYTQRGLLKSYKIGNSKTFYKKDEVLKSLTEIQV